MSEDPALLLTLEWLGAKRRHVIGTLDGLAEADVRRSVLPSGWSLLGAVHHLAVDVERFWLRAVVGGEDVTFPDDEAWETTGSLGVAEVVELYRAESAAGDAVLRTRAALDPLAWWPEGLDSAPYASVHEVLHHVLVETATHAGHLDVVRELIDGHQRLVLT